MRHSNDCLCDMCSKDPFERELEAEQRARAFKERCHKLDKAHALLEFLGIPYHMSYAGDEYMSVVDLYDILMDEEKLKELVSKLKLKAFW